MSKSINTKNQATPSIKSRVFRQLNKEVERGVAVSFQDTSAYSLYMASLLGVKITTVERYFREYKASHIETALINLSPASALSTTNNSNK